MNTVTATRRRWFRLLAALLVILFVELGSFLILSFMAGSVVTPGDLRALQASRQDTEVVDFEEDKDEEALLREHRIRSIPVLHPYTGYVPDPTTHRVAGDPGFSRQAANLGFPFNRNDVFWSPSEERLVIATFGGSFGASFGARSKTLTAAFERVERWRGKRLVFLNFGVGGYKQPQQLMALNYLLFLGAHFDVVINLDGFNEIALPSTINVPKGYFAHYPRGWVLQVGDLDQDLRSLVGELTYLLELRARLARSFAGAPWRFSFTAGLVWKVLDALETGRISRAERAIQDARSEKEMSYQTRGPEWSFSDDAEMYAELVAAWKRASIQMDALCRELGIEYYHFLQPNQYLPGSKPMGAEEHRTAFQEDHPYRGAVEAAYPLLIRAGEELRARGVRFLDLTAIYEDHPEPLYRDSCCHVTGAGYRLVAEAVAEAVDQAP